jgi:5-oxoprolinase (ATP-hydrolysing) subunit A
MKKRIELASDMGESFGNYTLGQPEEVMKIVNSVYVACGYHAGDPLVMHQTVKWCKQYGVVLGAHPGFPDLMGFGRRYMKITLEEARDYVIYQIGALKNFAEEMGVKIVTAKPHGAFYSYAIENEEQAKAVLDGLKTIGSDFAVALPALPVSPLHELLKESGIRLIGEIYPGLSYKKDGGIIVTRKYEADPEKESRIVMKYLKTGKVDTIEGTEVEINAESVLLHGDIPNAPEVILTIRKTLEAEGVEIRAAIES